MPPWSTDLECDYALIVCIKRRCIGPLYELHQRFIVNTEKRLNKPFVPHFRSISCVLFALNLAHIVLKSTPSSTLSPAFMAAALSQHY